MRWLSFQVVKIVATYFAPILFAQSDLLLSVTKAGSLTYQMSWLDTNYLLERAINHCSTASKFVSSFALMP